MFIKVWEKILGLTSTIQRQQLTFGSFRKKLVSGGQLGWWSVKFHHLNSIFLKMEQKTYPINANPWYGTMGTIVECDFVS